MTTTAALAAITAAFISPVSVPSSQVGGTEPANARAALPGSLSPAALSALGAELLIDEPGDGRTWARGPSWKASFGEEGMTYIPFFGSDAPQNHPVTFDLARVSLGGEQVPLADRSRTRDGQSVELDRAALREVYHLAKESVEQTFVFDELPARQELVLEIDVKTDLVAQSLGEGFVFSNELGEVHYGAATAFDAKGRSLELHQELTDSGLCIVVPEHFVSTATLPLVVDPIVTTLSITSDGRRQLDADVAYEDSNGRYQIVYSEVQSGVDIDVISVTYDVQLNLLLQPSPVDTTSATWGSPRNASNFHEQQFLCVSTVGFLVGSQKIWGRTQDASTGALGPQFEISGFGATNADVGGKGNEISSIYDYMVVWQEVDTLNQDFDIVAQAVNGGSSLTGGRITIDGDSTDLDRHPSISKSSGRPGTANVDSDYMVVWEREISPTNHNLRGQVMNYTGTMTGSSQFNVYTFSDALEPDVSSVSNAYPSFGEPFWVVAFRRLVAGNYKIFTVVAQDGNADNARSVNTMQNLDVDANHRTPRIAQSSRGYLIAYQTDGAALETNVHMTVAGVVREGDELRMGLFHRRDDLAVSEDQIAEIGIASAHDGGRIPTIGGEALVVWAARASAGADTEVGGAFVDEFASPASGSQYCEANVNSTGTSAWIRSNGFSLPGFPRAALLCSDLPPNSFGHFLISSEAGFAANPGGSQGNLCLQGDIGRFNRPGEVLNSGFNGSFGLEFQWDSLPSPNGTVMGQLGDTWYFQCWYRDIGPSSNFSNAVEVFRY